MENSTSFNKFAIPLRWGLIIGIVSILLFTVYSMFLMTSMGIWGTMGLGVFSFVIIMILLGVMAMQQRKGMGGFITFREAFSAVFISILVMVVLSQLYTYIYMNFIDPDYFERMREMSLDMAYTFGGTDEQADMAAEQVEKQIEKQKNISSIFMGMAGSVILYSLFGFIIAAVVKRNKPEHLQA